MKLFPDSWSIEEVCNLCLEIVDCVNKTAPVVAENTGFKMIRTTNVRHGRVDVESVRYVTEATFKKWTRRVLPRRGDVILTREAPLGEVGLLRTDDKVFLGQRTMLYRANPKILDQEFLYYSLLGPIVRSQILTLGSGATVEHLRVPHCEKLQIPIPKVEVQKKIASILSAYDDLIENNKRRIAILEKMAEEIYREWFVRMRFPASATATADKPKFRGHATLGLPNGWSTLKMGDIYEIEYGRNLPTDKIQSEGLFPVYGAGGVLGYYNKKNVTGRVSLITCRGNGSGTVWRTADEDAFVTNNSFKVRNKLINRDEFYFTYFHLKYCSVGQAISGSAQPQITIDGLSKVVALMPSLDLVEKFIELSKPILLSIDKLAEVNRLLSKTRDLLLPRLISGKLSVENLTLSAPSTASEAICQEASHA